MKRGSIYFLLSIFFIFNCAKSSDIPLNDLSDSGNNENDQEASFETTNLDQPAEDEDADLVEDHSEMFNIIRENNEELENDVGAGASGEDRLINDYNSIQSNIEKYTKFDNMDVDSLQGGVSDLMQAEGMDELISLYFKHKDGKIDEHQLIEQLKKLQKNKELLKAMKTFVTENYNVIKRHNLLDETQSLKNFESLAEGSLRFIDKMINGDLDEDSE
ncbi:conserved Plasmodium protein, unknown function [Plasmodium chabaudi chabaudi]|uniref:MSP7-like protein n=1 Tax=Plasmodium chabaudi chabaudi TaxID=31271 RepID=A0A4V0KBN4_PLACU|nr:conserved Plasmodium protein, unknown function [Plasmodium chabaudi chabaudi]VTZ70491.1 conserved Plasmodium protein, unknown function [Plasmodium chabaudi chabaudi]|eukprot:XP_736109.2 conserved Plasmodium protein, unknown function [Plasmodium chabaudi chabaudi]